MSTTEKDNKIPEAFSIKKEDLDPSERWLDIKEESEEYSAQADDVHEYKLSSLLLPIAKQESGDGSKSSVYKKTRTVISREEASSSDDNEKNLKSEEDEYPSEVEEEIPNYNDRPDDTCDVQFSPTYILPLPEGKTNRVKNRLTEVKQRPFMCDACNKAFALKRYLVEHMRIHTKEKPFTCDVCNKSFNRRSNLMNHMKVHSKERPFSCDVCKKLFPRKQSLKIHIRIHTGENLFTCDFCNKGFAQRSNYVEHIRIHTNEKPFACDICNRAFARKSNLNKHNHTHARKKPIVCDRRNFIPIKPKPCLSQLSSSLTDPPEIIPKATN